MEAELHREHRWLKTESGNTVTQLNQILVTDTVERASDSRQQADKSETRRSGSTRAQSFLNIWPKTCQIMKTKLRNVKSKAVRKLQVFCVTEDR